MHSLLPSLVAIGVLVRALPAQAACIPPPTKLRTVVTTDMEQDDLTSLIRYLLYTNELDTQGVIYTASKWHWAGDGKGTEFFLPDREYDTPLTSWRWTCMQSIQDIVIPAYAAIYPNLIIHEPSYPTPDELLSLVKIGNIDFEGEMANDTDGSNLIRSLLLDDDPRTLYLQAWGGVNTIARALKSIEDQYSGTSQWASIKAAVSRKAVILASGFQDETYTNYVSLNWTQLRVENLEAGYSTWGYNCNVTNQGNLRGLPDHHLYYTGAFIRANIETGPYGHIYRSWLDGQKMAGDPEDIFGTYSAALNSSNCLPLGPYDFLSEGDNVAFNPLLTTGLQDPANPTLGGWGGRSYQNSTSPDLWTLVPTEIAKNGSEVESYTTDRWAADAWNDYAARMQWGWTPDYCNGNHPPFVKILNGKTVTAGAGSTVTLNSYVSDPDGNQVNTSWWQYLEEGTYNGTVTVTETGSDSATVTVPADAKSGQNVSIILQGTDDGQFPLTRYDRIFIQVA